MSRTKIVCTIGPKTRTPELLRALAAAGMGVARLNGSHATLSWHAETIALIRDVLPQIPILLDIPGRKIRTAQLDHEPEFARGDVLVLTSEPGWKGREKVSVSSATLHESVKAGDVLFADDGTLRFTVVGVSQRDISCRAETAGQLRSRKGINVPFIKISGPLVAETDRTMVAFAHEHNVDYIGISFVESAQHVEEIRKLTGGFSPRIVSKIENRNGLRNMDEILAATDAAMIDRGDLSVETNLESVAVFQKQILQTAQRHGRPVIVATEMLHSMIEQPQPTKAEIADITNAVLDGAAATMLSGETAIGAFPVEAVQLMSAVANAAETLQPVLESDDGLGRVETVPDAMERGAALICRLLPITKIVAVTKSGFAASAIAARRPKQPILAVCNDQRTARAMNLLPGVEGIFVDQPFHRTSTDHVAQCLEHLWRVGRLVREDLILVAAVGYPRPGNLLNLLQTHRVEDLVNTFGWE